MYSLSDLVFPVACALPTEKNNLVITDRRLRWFPKSELRRIENVEQQHRDNLAHQVTESGYCPGRGERIQASAEFIGHRRVVSMYGGDICHDKDAAESRSQDRAKEKRRPRSHRLNHPRNAALSA